MKIGVINIDWFKKSKPLKVQILEEIRTQDLDFLVVNENILNFNFDKNYFQYHSKAIPTDREFQHLGYGSYLKGETPIRLSIYSKHKSIQSIVTNDAYTSVCHKFNVADHEVLIYGTIIGTWGIKHQQEIAKNELEDFKKDCEIILANHEYVFMVGDFNTSFLETEKRQLSTINSRTELIDFTTNLKVHRATEQIENCIDQIFVSDKLQQIAAIKTASFLENDSLKDSPHKGIILQVNFTK